MRSREPERGTRHREAAHGEPVRAGDGRIVDGLTRLATSQPSAVVLTCNGRAHTYEQLLASAKLLATTLTGLGLEPRDRVCILMPNSWASAVAIYGTFLAGGAIVVLNPQVRSDKLRFLLDDSKAKVLLGTENLLHRHESVVGMQAGLTALSWNEAGGWTETQRPRREVHPGRTGSHEPWSTPPDLAALIYTSGSTGEPKGVMMTHRSMAFTVATVSRYLRLAPDDRILDVLPLAHSYGLYQLLMAVDLGATLLLEESFAYPAHVIERMRSEQATVFAGVPTMFAALIGIAARTGLAVPSITRLTNAAAALPIPYVEALKNIFPNALIFQMYGLTECKRASYLEPELIDLKPGSVGKALAGTEAFVGDERGERLPAGRTGLLYVRGPHVMQGYWRRPLETAKVLRQGSDPDDKTLCTGDLFTTDEEGFLYFIGRSDDVLSVGGEKVSPSEIENVLYGVAGVREAAVVGIADALLGQRLRAFVSLEPGHDLTSATLRRACMTKLEPTHVPKDIIVLDALPRTDTGKIRKKSLRELELP